MKLNHRSPRNCFIVDQYIAIVFLLIITLAMPLTAAEQITSSQLKVQESGRLNKTTKDILPPGVDKTLRQLASDIRNKKTSGLGYLKKSGLDLIIKMPSLQQLVDIMRQQHKEGKVDVSTLRSLEDSLKSASHDERTKEKYISVPPGFDPASTLPRPYGLKTQDGQILNISENFMRRFKITTQYDLMRIIRNSSIILSNFSGPIDQDIFKYHQQRLRQALNVAANEDPAINRTLSIFNFTASLMIVDNLIPPTNTVLTTEEYYVAALIIGTEYKLFSAQANEPAAMPEVQTIGEGVIWRKSDNTDGHGMSLPPWTEIVVANVGFKNKPRVGDKATVIPLASGIPRQDLRIVKTELQQYGCEGDPSPAWWSVELEPITSPIFFSVAAQKNRRAEFPSDVAIIYPAVKRADLIETKRLMQDMLPKGIWVSTVKAAIDLTGSGYPDVLIIEYCCNNLKKSANECNYTCGKKFKRVNREWILVDSSKPC